MNIIVLHGDDIKQSYTRLNTILSQAKLRGLRTQRLTFDGNRSLSESLVSKSIFNEKVIYVAENVNQFPDKDLKWLKSRANSLEGELVIYFPGPLGKAISNLLPKEAKIEEFKLATFVWKFLDSFYPGNSKNCINFLHKVAETDELERVFALLARHLKNLYMLKLDKNSLVLPSWRLSRLISQASKFGKGKIENIISEMAKIDVEVKSSSTNLLDSLDFIIATKLE